MSTPHLLAADTWAPGGGPVELRETHISWVFLAGGTALKVKKPVRLPFVDYSTLERRRRFCHEEVRLNRRLAPRIYLGVRALVAGEGGELRLAAEDDPAALEYAVEMRRYDEDATLAARLERGESGAEVLAEVGARIARFHAEVPVVHGSAATARLEALLAETLESLSDLGAGATLAGTARFCRAALAGCRGVLDHREARGHVRDGHGDLRAEHVLLEAGIEVVDCVEFDASMRAMDVGADLAFLMMDVGRYDTDGPGVLRRAYRDAGGDPGDERLLCLYAAFRALVRAKVELVRADQLTDPARDRHQRAAREYLGQASRWAWRGRLSGTIVLAGLSGSGKSTLARALSVASGRERLASDVVRKARLGLAPGQRANRAVYVAAISHDVYDELGRRARRLSARDGGVLVDATCRRPEDREVLQGHVSSAFVIECVAPEAVLFARVRARAHDLERVSDAGATVLRAQLDQLEAWDEPELGSHRMILDTTRPVPDLLDTVAGELDAHLADGVGVG